MLRTTCDRRGCREPGRRPVAEFEQMPVRWPKSHLPVAQMQDRSPLESIRGPGFRQLRRTNRAAVLHLSTSNGAAMTASWRESPSRGGSCARSRRGERARGGSHDSLRETVTPATKEGCRCSKRHRPAQFRRQTLSRLARSTPAGRCRCRPGLRRSRNGPTTGRRSRRGYRLRAHGERRHPRPGRPSRARGP
ncbi:MAG: hypothetical protein JWO01_1067 [Microbacteriaceae bacterium]|nr:hypothetical protein [Microbacteriaceae bacterium]